MIRAALRVPLPPRRPGRLAGRTGPAAAPRRTGLSAKRPEYSSTSIASSSWRATTCEPWALRGTID
ncbi:MAG TPA: hypothetical protein VMK42_02515 [Anaeromyxobacteraceae bacterium]|nr:hypothetical protein [Anaeromyxobacteraceae bacterium]